MWYKKGKKLFHNFFSTFPRGITRSSFLNHDVWHMLYHAIPQWKPTFTIVSKGAASSISFVRQVARKKRKPPTVGGGLSVKMGFWGGGLFGRGLFGRGVIREGGYSGGGLFGRGVIREGGYSGGGLFGRGVIREWGLIRSFTVLFFSIYA